MMTSSIIRKEYQESAIPRLRPLNERVNQGNSLVRRGYLPIVEAALTTARAVKIYGKF